MTQDTRKVLVGSARCTRASEYWRYDPQKMRIAFVSGNREKLPDACVPLGLLYVMASTPRRHERTLFDLCFEQEPEEAMKRWLERTPHDLVALGMRNPAIFS